MGLEHRQEEEKDRGVEVQLMKGKLRRKKHICGCICSLHQLLPCVSTRKSIGHIVGIPFIII